MSRKQSLEDQGTIVIASSAVPEALSASELFAKSVFIQSDIDNTDYIFVGNESNQSTALGPGQNVQINADALDLGGGGIIDLSKIRVRAAANGLSFNWSYLKGY